MKDDLLERSTRAFAAETAERGPSELRLQQTLRRLERAGRPALSRRRTLRTLYWTLAALCVGMGAWANATGRIDSWFESEPEPPPAPAAAVASDPAPLPHTPRASEPAPLEVAPPVLEPPPLAPPDPGPPRAPRPAAALPKPPPPDEPPRSAELPAPNVDDVYHEAHRAHFNQRDYRAALPLWERYLELAGPAHVLLPEARFNRAIALYRLEQWAAAQSALEPFASGEYGRYRREDAQRLLEAIAQKNVQH
jgi:tetratricopeptide (TPR) repeat protein